MEIPDALSTAKGILDTIKVIITTSSTDFSNFELECLDDVDYPVSRGGGEDEDEDEMSDILEAILDDSGMRSNYSALAPVRMIDWHVKQRVIETVGLC